MGLYNKLPQDVGEVDVITANKERPNPLSHPKDAGRNRTVRARKLVISSIGARATPSLLEGSIAGDPLDLKHGFFTDTGYDDIKKHT